MAIDMTPGGGTPAQTYMFNKPTPVKQSFGVEG